MPNFALCSSSAIVYKAGDGVDKTAAASGALLDQFYREAEGRFVGNTHRDWVASANTLNPGVSGAVSLAIASMGGNLLASFNSELYPSREIYQTLLDVNDDNARKVMRELKDFDSSLLKGVA